MQPAERQLSLNDYAVSIPQHTTSEETNVSQRWALKTEDWSIAAAAATVAVNPAPSPAPRAQFVLITERPGKSVRGDAISSARSVQPLRRRRRGRPPTKDDAGSPTKRSLSSWFIGSSTLYRASSRAAHVRCTPDDSQSFAVAALRLLELWLLTAAACCYSSRCEAWRRHVSAPASHRLSPD